MAFTVRKRYVQLTAVLSFVVLLILKSILNPINSLSKSFNFIDSLSASIVSEVSASAINADTKFDALVDQLLRKKKKSDVEFKYWALDTEISSAQTHIKVPPYFKGLLAKKPTIGPFDPRFTLAIYYNYITHHPETFSVSEVPFHWSDWVDMTVLNPYFFSVNESEFECSVFDQRPYMKESDDYLQKGAIDPAKFCRKLAPIEDNGLGFVIDRYFGRGINSDSILLGKAYLYSSAPNPIAITFLTKDGSYSINVASEKTSMLKNTMVSEYLKENGMKMEINTLEEFHKLQKLIPPAVDEVVSDYEVHLKHEDFVYDAKKTLQGLESNPPLGLSKSRLENYVKSVQNSLDTSGGPPKYFHEARIFNSSHGDHYDWRFFNGIIENTPEQTNTLHRLVRCWLSFTRKQGIITWMAHGSLLSWYWNGVAFPWDNDIDVQVPVMGLHKLSLKFNQSLIVEDIEDGFGRYFLDCGSSINTRNHNNGNNNIDARFIDVDTGLYIDITALAVSKDKSPERYHDALPKGYEVDKHPPEVTNDLLQVYNCRNFHFSSLAEMSPLIKTSVEGEVAYIPKHYSDILTYEYEGKGILQKNFSGWLFVPQLRLWVYKDDLSFFLRHRQEWLHYHDKLDGNHQNGSLPQNEAYLNNKEIKLLLSLTELDFLDLLHSDHLLMTYISSRELTALHEKEITKLLFGKSTEEIINNAPDMKPLRYEPFLYRLNSAYTTFDARVKLFQQLQEQKSQRHERTDKSEEESDGENSGEENSD